MYGKYHIDPSIDVPIYRQLSDAIAADIINGTKAYGETLPTVQEFANRLSLAKGTVKRCYDQLEREGYVEKTQGSGTFVKYKNADKSSRKDAALSAIDEMLEKLEELNISESEASIFIDLKLKERRLPDSRVGVAVVASCREILSSLSESVREIEGTDVFSYTLSDVLKYPYKMGGEADIIVTHGEIYDKLLTVVPDVNKLFCVELTFSLSPFAAAKGKTTAVVCDSTEFYGAVTDYCNENRLGVLPLRVDFSDVSETDGCSYIIVPDGFERFCGEDTAKLICGRSPVRVKAVPDKGSARYLRDRIKKKLSEKQK